MKRLTQLKHPDQGRRVALVVEDTLELIESYNSVYDLAWAALSEQRPLTQLVEESRLGQSLDYNPIYAGQSEWKLLPSFDHPRDPSRCLVSGTGLTHKASADQRQSMHDEVAEKVEITDSLRMFQWGLEGGHPEAGKIGVQPEWFYKGQGQILRAHGEPLAVPSHADDGGEEPEVAGLYIIDAEGRPWRVGLAIGNEFSDHVMEKKNYLYLAPSKLRDCAIGPELTVDSDYSDLAGVVRIERAGETLWSKPIVTGEANMSHSLANLEHHHFKYPAHRNPGDAHVHFFGAAAFSFGEDVELSDGDVMEVAWQGLGRPLRNPLGVGGDRPSLVGVNVLR